MRISARELLLAIAVFAILVGSFVNCQIVAKALRATERLATIHTDR
jgi:phosphosulfolactate phosphohydrolase-like enzyme